jgi:geranylgeranyl diphosphate synthase type II
MKEELHQWINAPHFNPAEKVEAVTSIYKFLNVKELANEEMKKHYNIAKEFLEKIPVTEAKKLELIEFADSLMVREI